MTSCDQEGCTKPGTHTVVVALAGEDARTWHMCRPHERNLKIAAVRTRVKAEPPKDKGPIIECLACGRVLQPTESPCPDCGSRDRSVTVADTITAHEDADLRVRGDGDSQTWHVKLKAGDNYTRNLDAWGRRELLIDKERDLYREVIELYDGSRIESTARESDHH